MAKERFEVRLGPDEAAEIHARMRRVGVTSKADHVRNCLLGLTNSEPGRLDDEVGHLGLCLSELIARADTAGWDAPVVAGLVRRVARALHALQKAIAEMGRA